VQVALGQVRREFKNKILFQHRDFPFRSLTERAAEAGRCAGGQGKEDQMRTLIFNGQREWGLSSSPDNVWEKYAGAAGANVQEWKACFSSRKYRSEIQKDVELGKSMGVEATPTIFVGNQKIVGAVPYQTLAEAIRKQLNQ
jgi:protein-disulfide isomerase